jgi:AraC-like DNA-binding protein/mannose-6-phosphate isomerase-like protein (cupin superfamily)
MFVYTAKEFLLGRKHVAIWRETTQVPVVQHRHEFFEIVVILSGTGVHVTGNYRHQLKPGDILILNPGRAHGYEKTQNLNLINILVPEETITRIGRSMSNQAGYQALFHREAPQRKQGYPERLNLSPEEVDLVVGLVDRIDEEFKRGVQAVRLLEEACLALIIDLLCRRYCGKRKVHSQTALRHERGDAAAYFHMGNILSWIEKNLHLPLSVTDLAARAGMSERSLYNTFQKTLGITPQAHVARVRMRHAALRLSDPNERRSITEIATACGFEDSNYFSLCFRRFAGMTPREYRKKSLLSPTLQPSAPLQSESEDDLAGDIEPDVNSPALSSS